MKQKEQLKDLLDKGFIRASISPWGAPILFVRKNRNRLGILKEIKSKVDFPFGRKPRKIFLKYF